MINFLYFFIWQDNHKQSYISLWDDKWIAENESDEEPPHQKKKFNAAIFIQHNYKPLSCLADRSSVIGWLMLFCGTSQVHLANQTLPPTKSTFPSRLSKPWNVEPDRQIYIQTSYNLINDGFRYLTHLLHFLWATSKVPSSQHQLQTYISTCIQSNLNFCISTSLPIVWRNGGDLWYLLANPYVY